MLDLVIRNGMVIDGTGSPRRLGDVGVRDGRVVVVGEILEEALTEVDATGLVVAPGFVDVHTHFDAQVFWDTTLSPSPLHGVTTVIGGNCGFTIAPLEPDGGDYLMRMLARVEGMPLASLQEGVPWSWRTFGEYLDTIEGTLMPNAGFLVGHSALRRMVMGERSIGEFASDKELHEMKKLLAESIEAGGLGFSSSWAKTHNDAEGNAVPSRHASERELVELCSVLRDTGAVALEFIPTVERFDESVYQLLTDMSVAADRPLNWNVIFANARQADVIEEKLQASNFAARQGGRVIALTAPMPAESRLCFESGFLLDTLHGWAEPMALPNAQKLALLADPVRRAELNEDAQHPSAFRGLARWERLTVGEVTKKDLKHFEGRTIGEIAEKLGQTPWDALCEIVVADDLKTGLYPPAAGDNEESWALRQALWNDDRCLIGASDAGAHLDFLATFNYSTYLLAAARDRELLSLELAVHKLTDAPARLYGLKHRGRIAPGWWADLVVFDADKVAPEEVEVREDLPGGAWRLYGEAVGVHHVFINGEQAVEDGRFTDARPGTLLRAGRDTDPVTAIG
ncbi:MAG: amidohydrolase family protein [Actinomycetota bacterium]|nr:aminoacylase [Acidimicrobiaceae bacterium]MED5553214.1 amidohydrolase family protein [Actinomycetota bacterium]MEE2807084.1 amidohydrolase family protein [Actinomycetota bacterium]MEE3140543.1 amidohydrolase family protein [Actinomycetota bacterium]